MTLSVIPTFGLPIFWIAILAYVILMIGTVMKGLQAAHTGPAALFQNGTRAGLAQIARPGLSQLADLSHLERNHVPAENLDIG